MRAGAGTRAADGTVVAQSGVPLRPDGWLTPACAGALAALKRGPLKGATIEVDPGSFEPALVDALQQSAAALRLT